MKQTVHSSRPRLKVVEQASPLANTAGLASSEKKLLVILQALSERSPVENLRLAVSADGSLRIRKRCNQLFEFVSPEGYISFSGNPSSLLEVAHLLCKRGALTEFRSRPFIDGRLVEHVIFELTEHGVQMAKALCA